MLPLLGSLCQRTGRSLIADALQIAMAEQRDDTLALPLGTEFGTGWLQGLANTVRGLADHMQASGCHCPDALKSDIVSYLASLDQLAVQSRLPNVVLAHKHRWGYPLEHLVRVVLLVARFHGCEPQLAPLLRNCLEACLPTSLAKASMEHMQTQTLPSLTTIRRHKLTVHVGWMQRLRKELAQLLRECGGHVAKYLTCDSSPQGGHDFMNVSSLVLPSTALVRLMRDFHLLYRTPKENLCLDDAKAGDLEISEVALGHLSQEYDLVSRLRLALRWKQGVPVELGAGRGNMWHKMHALIHSLYLVSPSWRVLVAQLQSVVAIVSDLGVEGMLFSTPRFHLSSLFPWAADAFASASALDGDAAENARFDFESEQYVIQVALKHACHE